MQKNETICPIFAQHVYLLSFYSVQFISFKPFFLISLTMYFSFLYYLHIFFSFLSTFSLSLSFLLNFFHILPIISFFLFCILHFIFLMFLSKIFLSTIFVSFTFLLTFYIFPTISPFKLTPFAPPHLPLSIPPPPPPKKPDVSRRFLYRSTQSLF